MPPALKLSIPLSPHPSTPPSRKAARGCQDSFPPSALRSPGWVAGDLWRGAHGIPADGPTAPAWGIRCPVAAGCCVRPPRTSCRSQPWAGAVALRVLSRCDQMTCSIPGSGTSPPSPASGASTLDAPQNSRRLLQRTSLLLRECSWLVPCHVRAGSQTPTPLEQRVGTLKGVP